MMPKPVVRIRLTNEPRDFQIVSAAAGMPLIDRHKTADSLFRVWLRRFAAEPAFVGEHVEFYVRDEQGRPVADIVCELVRPAELKKQLRSEFEEFKTRLAAATPPSESARELHRFVTAGFDGSVPANDFVRFNCQLYKYRDHDGLVKLVWCPGFAPTQGRTCLRPALCRNPDCRRLITGNVETLEEMPCPDCGRPVVDAPPRRKLLRSLLASVLLLALVGGGVWYYFGRPPGAVAGRVTTTDGRPLQNAIVRVVEADVEATTDEDGRFRIERAGRASITLDVVRDGYQTRSQSVDVPAGGAAEVEIGLTGAAQVVGRVVYRFGGQDKPIAGAQVVANTQTVPLTTDADGLFRIPDLGGGAGVTLDVAAAGFHGAKASAIAKVADESPSMIVLIGDGKLEGRTVFAADPKFPVAKAEVVAVGVDGARVVSDEGGKFAFADLPPIDLELEAAAPGMTASGVKCRPGGDAVVIPMAGTAVLVGEAVRRDDGEALSEVEVRTLDLPFVAKTDAQGKFRIEGMPLGTVRLRASAPGLVGIASVELKAGKPAATKVLLSGGALIRGRILDAEMRPVPEAIVRIADTALEAKSDAEGKYELIAVPESATSMTVSAAHFVTSTVPLKLKSGEQELAEIPLAAGAMLVGRVVGGGTGEGREKRPIAGAEITVVGRAEKSVTDAEGKFRIGPLPPGEVVIKVVATQHVSREVGYRLTADDLSTDDVALTSVTTLRGRVVRALDRKPLSGAIIRSDAGTTSPAATISAITDGSGEFRLADIPFGKAEVRITAAGYVEQSIKRDIVRADASLGVIELVGETAPTGMVVDATDKTKPIVGAVLDVEIGDYKATVTTGADGRFRLANVPPSVVKISARAAGYMSESLNKSVTSTNASIEVPLRRLIDVAGTVIAAGSSPKRPIANAKVTIVSGNERRETVSAADGSFRMKELPPLPMQIVIEAAGHQAATISDFKGDRPLDVELLTLTVIRGRVFVAERTTQGIADAHVIFTKTGYRQEAVTDAQGDFVAEVPIGDIEVVTTAEGYLTTTGPFRVTDANAPLTFGLARAATIKGYVVDATTNKSVAGVTVEAVVGAVRKRTTTDDRGMYALEQLPFETATTTFSSPSFQPYSVSVAPGEGNNVRAVLSPKLSEGTARVVLTWGDRPRDLDIHLLGVDADNKPFHVGFGSRKAGGAVLEIDDKDGFGPETCTIKIGPQPVRVYVADPENIGTDASAGLAQSLALVQVYLPGESESRIFRLPAKPTGPVWHVFNISQPDSKDPVSLTPGNGFAGVVPEP